MREIGKSSIVLMIALLWQFVSICFAADVIAAAPIASHIGTTQENKGQQLSMVAGAKLVLLEAKRPERIAKGGSQPESISDTNNHYYPLASITTQYTRPMNSRPWPVKRGYWLIYRALLI